MVKKGPGALMAKINIKARIVSFPSTPIIDAPGNNMGWTRVRFGLGSAPKIFTAIADWVAGGRGANNILHCLEDVILNGATSSDECRVAMQTLLRISAYLSLRRNWKA